MDIAASSPDGRWHLVLKYEDEIHFGPSYYSLWLRQDPVERYNRFHQLGATGYFGAASAFSPESRYLVVESWASLRAPDTTCIVLDLESGSEAELLHLGVGFVRKIGFDGNGKNTEVVLTVERYEKGNWVTSTASIELSQLRWTRTP